MPHGNSKSKKPFFPTLPSTKELIAQQRSGPKETVSIVTAKVGGIVNARSASDLPRNERQASYIHCKMKPRASCHGDEMFQMIQEAKVGDSAGLFVRETRSSPEPAFILAREYQLDDLVRFCTVSADFSILTVDPTFNIGAFDVTPITYRNILLETVRYGSSPVFIGPTMIHYRKTFSTYLFFAASLIGSRPELQGVRAFGTDGEKALADGFKHEFRYATHLTCFIHFRRNIKQQLQERGFSPDAIVEIIDDLMGTQKGQVFFEGLVDSASGTQFQQKLAMLKERWQKFDGGESFYLWLCEHKVDIIEQTMLKEVREDAHLGCPPTSFTTNASETINFVLKNKVDYKECQLVEFVQKLKQVVDDQEKEVEKAVIQRGKYRFKSQFKHLEVSEVQWYKMTPQQRRKHLDRVARASVGNEPSYSVPPSLASDSSMPVLSVDVQQAANEIAIPLACLQGIWTKASELLTSTENIVSAPGCDPAARLVISRTGKRPHLVLPTKAGYKCDSDCANFKGLGICSHTVVVAHLNDQLLQFVKSLKKAKKKPNMTSLALHGMPTGTGRKGSRPPRKRAKPSTSDVEQRVERLVPETSSVPSPSFTNSSTDSFPTGTYTPLILPRPYYSPSPFGQPYPSPYAAPFPSGSVCGPSQESPFTLVFITGNISVCSGCSGRYSKPVVAPHDICVKHTEMRRFTLPDGTPKNKFAPAYYHVHLHCLQINWPSFHAMSLVIEPEVYSQLSDSHLNVLRTFGCYI